MQDETSKKKLNPDGSKISMIPYSYDRIFFSRHKDSYSEMQELPWKDENEGTLK